MPENVTQQKKKQTNKFFPRFWLISYQNGLSCGTWHLNNFTGNEIRKPGLYVFDSFPRILPNPIKCRL